MHRCVLLATSHGAPLAQLQSEAHAVVSGDQLTNTILDIVQQAANYKQLRKGANEGALQHPRS